MAFKGTLKWRNSFSFLRILPLFQWQSYSNHESEIESHTTLNWNFARLEICHFVALKQWKKRPNLYRALCSPLVLRISHVNIVYISSSGFTFTSVALLWAFHPDVKVRRDKYYEEHECMWLVDFTRASVDFNLLLKIKKIYARSHESIMPDFSQKSKTVSLRQ